MNSAANQLSFFALHPAMAKGIKLYEEIQKQHKEKIFKKKSPK
jgi:hypothetical protein